MAEVAKSKRITGFAGPAPEARSVIDRSTVDPTAVGDTAFEVAIMPWRFLFRLKRLGMQCAMLSAMDVTGVAFLLVILHMFAFWDKKVVM